MSSFTVSESVYIRELIEKYGLEKLLSSTTLEAEYSNVSTSKYQLIGILNLILCREWFFLNLFSCLGIQDIARFDSAYTNHETRRVWLKCPKLQLKNEDGKFNNDLPIYWCTKKNVYYISFRAAYVCSGKLDITNNGLMSFAKQCKYLKSFSISGTDELTEQGLVAICQNSLILQSFNLESTGESTNQRKLIHFDILHNLNQHCPLLESLELKYFDLSQLNISPFTFCWKFLKSVKVASTYGLGNNFLMNFGSNCHLIESIVFIVIHQDADKDLKITNEGVTSMLSGCPQLKLLKMNILHFITDDAFTSISQYCPQLEEIHLDNIFIRDNALIALGKLRSLKTVYFPNSHGVTVAGVRGLVCGCLVPDSNKSNTADGNIDNHNHHQQISQCSSLRLLSPLVRINICLEYIPSLICASLRLIADNCPLLEYLTIVPQDDNISNNFNLNNDVYTLDDCLKYLIIDKCKHLIQLTSSFKIPIAVSKVLKQRLLEFYRKNKKVVI